MHDAILIVDDKEKNISSSAGHSLMNAHPAANIRYQNANNRLQDILAALKSGDWESFIETVEAEALELHALMMTSSPAYILMKPNTLAIIQSIINFRLQSGASCCFTLDAGANVHLIYSDADKLVVEQFINSNLLKYCINSRVIYDKMGAGPEKIYSE